MEIASGQDAIMTVVGTVLLDNAGLNHKQELCVQSKAPLVAEKVMIELIKVCTIFVLVNAPRFPNTTTNFCTPILAIRRLLEYCGLKVTRVKYQIE